MNFETSLPEYVFTSQIPTLVFAQAGAEPMRVTLLDEQNIIFETTLYPVGGKMYVYDVGRLYEEYFRGRNVNVINPIAFFQLSIGNYLWEDRMIIYCPFNCSMAAVDFITSHFLTTLSAKRIPEDCQEGEEWIDVLLTGDEGSETQTVNIQATFRNPDGETEAHECSYNANWDELYSRFKSSPEQIWILFNQYCEEELEFSWSELTPVAYSFSIGNRKLTYYVDPEFKPSARFRFRNAFNVEETFYLEGETVTKTDTERSMASSHGVSLFYDQVDAQEYEVTTAPLSPEEAAWATQMLLSHDVKRVEEDGSTVEVMITDMTDEVSDNDREHKRLKFTYRLAKQGASLNVNKRAFESRRFANQFTIQFA